MKGTNKVMKKAMKKVLSVLLTVAMLASALCINAYAAETSITKEKLFKLIDSYEWYGSLWGTPSVQYQYLDVLITATDVYNDENSTEADYQEALDMLKNANLNDMLVHYDYAEATYELASKEKNYNNWYSEEDWAEFQNKLSDLKAVLDASERRVESPELTSAFRSLLDIYNKMTNEYTLKGDLNKDGEVNVSDVTLLQKYLVGSENLTGAQKMLANAEEYENPSIIEATLIQKYAAGEISQFDDYDNFFIEDEYVNYLDENMVYERTLNFNICPRKINYQYIRNEYKYQSYKIIFSYFMWCHQNGYEP